MHWRRRLRVCATMDGKILKCYYEWRPAASSVSRMHCIVCVCVRGRSRPRRTVHNMPAYPNVMRTLNNINNETFAKPKINMKRKAGARYGYCTHLFIARSDSLMHYGLVGRRWTQVDDWMCACELVCT